MGLFHFYNPYLSAEGGRLVSLITHRSKEIYDVSGMLSALISYLVSGEWNLEDPSERLELLSNLQEFAKYDANKRAIKRSKSFWKKEAV